MRDFRESVVYEVYIRSFQDTDGDGTGDLQGIIQRLDYLKELGVDYLWITPFYVSPLVDNGYDVADYRNIDATFGTMADLEELIKKAEDRGIGIMLDMVFNHSSTEHKWFQKALAGEEKYRDYYIIKENSEGPPTNWVSKFGGNAWEKLPGGDEWYLHLFHKTQADLNWENPELRQEIYDIIAYWIEKGVRGFRFDVINLISKPEVYEDATTDDGRHFYTDGPKIHDYLQEINQKGFGNHRDLITVGEMSSTSLDNCIRYSNPAGTELSMTFSFHHLKVDYKDGNKWTLMPYDFQKLKELISSWQVGMTEGGGWNAVFLNNHDQPRAVSRFGSEDHHYASATMLATMYHLLRGTPYIYQGEEFGMTNAHFDDISQYNDVESLNYYEILKAEGMAEADILKIIAAKSRDNARTPMQWDDSPGRGFTQGSPWLTFGKKPEHNARADMASSQSIFRYYQRLIDLRHEDAVIQTGDFKELLPGHETLFIYQRELAQARRLILLNFSRESQSIPRDLDLEGMQVILTNQAEPSEGSLAPFEARVLAKD